MEDIEGLGDISVVAANIFEEVSVSSTGTCQRSSQCRATSVHETDMFMEWQQNIE